MFVEAFKREGGLWIMKPVGRCQGRGIFMLDRLGQAATWKKVNDEREAEKKEIYVVSKCASLPCHRRSLAYPPTMPPTLNVTEIASVCH